MKQLTGAEFKALREAIQAAYRSRLELKRVVREELGVSLNQIAPESVSFEATVMELIEWAEAKGKLEALLRGFLAEAENPTLRQLCDRLLQQAPPPPPPKSPKPIARRSFLGQAGQLVGWTVAGSIGAVVTSRLLSPPIDSSSNDPPEVSPESPPIDAPAESAATDNGLARFRAETVTVDDQGNITASQTIEPEYFTETINGMGIEMVAIAGGRFWMGSPDGEESREDNESPQHEVSVPDFFLGKFTVTQAQWRAVAQLPQINQSLKAGPSGFKGDNRPVERVSWDEAQEFCARLSQATGKAYRLPSEAQWEYACRAGTTTPFAFGATLNTDIVNYDGNYTYGNGKKGVYREQTIDVGSFPPNAWGLYDMHGNVYEWCEDSWHDNYNGAPTDGTAWIDNGTEYKLLRGGSWAYNPRDCRSANRYNSTRDNQYNNLGFRLSLPRT
jgi:formylglycine-generating enzyme required for sulfatase activity